MQDKAKSESHSLNFFLTARPFIFHLDSVSLEKWYCINTPSEGIKRCKCKKQTRNLHSCLGGVHPMNAQGLARFPCSLKQRGQQKEQWRWACHCQLKEEGAGSISKAFYNLSKPFSYVVMRCDHNSATSDVLPELSTVCLITSVRFTHYKCN